MKNKSKNCIIGIVCLFGLLFHPAITFSKVNVSEFAKAELKSDTSEFVTISGIVMDEKGAAISNVGVQIAGTYRNSRMTLSDGSFEIKVPSNQKFYLYFQHVNFLIMSAPINSEHDIRGLKIGLKELVCHLDLIKDIVSCPPDEYRNDLPIPVFKKSEEEQMEVYVVLNRVEMAGGEFYYLPRFKRQKSEILYGLGPLSKEVEGHFQGTFIVDIDGLVKNVKLDGDSNKKAAEVIEAIFLKTGKWGPAKNYGRPVASKFTFCVDLP